MAGKTPKKAVKQRQEAPRKEDGGQDHRGQASHRESDQTAEGRREVLFRGRSRPVLLSGGNPQIAKGYGDAPVQAYIAAMPGWKSDLGRRLDALIIRTVPDVHKAVKWNSPLYGMEGDGWFLGLHVFTKYVKVAFFRGAPPSAPSRQGNPSREEVALPRHPRETIRSMKSQFTAWVQAGQPSCPASGCERILADLCVRPLGMALDHSDQSMPDEASECPLPYSLDTVTEAAIGRITRRDHARVSRENEEGTSHSEDAP